MSSFPINLCFGHLIILQNTLLYSSFRLVQIVLSFVAFFLCFKIIYLLFTCLSITTVPYLSRVGILFLVQRETHGRLLASLFKILMLLVSSTPYESSSLSDLIFFKPFSFTLLDNLLYYYLLLPMLSFWNPIESFTSFAKAPRGNFFLVFGSPIYFLDNI
jgi:hypothetical protein